MNKDIEQSNKNVEYIYNIIKSEIESLGLNICITSKNKFQEDVGANRILITLPNNPDFHAEILGREWNDYNRASIWVESERIRTLEGKNYSDGSPSYHTHRYRFESYLTSEEIESIGLVKQNYRYDVRQLNVAFKATKNPKLILNDIIPNIKKYLKIIQIVTPKIDEHIQKENETLELQKYVNQFDKYKHPIFDLGRKSFNTKHGEITITEYGDIEIKKSLTKDELLQLFA